MVRAAVLPLVSLPLWHSLSPARRLRELRPHAHLADLWGRLEARRTRTAATLAAAAGLLGVDAATGRAVGVEREGGGKVEEGGGGGDTKGGKAAAKAAAALAAWEKEQRTVEFLPGLIREFLKVRAWGRGWGKQTKGVGISNQLGKEIRWKP